MTLLTHMCRLWHLWEVLWLFKARQCTQVLTENEQGKRVAISPTLFYLPHCEGGLCSNVLRANAGSLGKIAILGNSFRSYYDQWSWKDEPSKQQRCETAVCLACIAIA